MRISNNNTAYSGKHKVELLTERYEVYSLNLNFYRNTKK